MKKITKKENFTNIQSILTQHGYNDLAEVMAHEIELLEKKSPGPRNVKSLSAKKSSNKDKAPTKTQVENEKLKSVMLDYMTPGFKYTITNLITIVPDLRDKTNQKVNSLVTQLKNAGQVERIEEKGVAYFVKVGE